MQGAEVVGNVKWGWLMPDEEKEIPERKYNEQFEDAFKALFELLESHCQHCAEQNVDGLSYLIHRVTAILAEAYQTAKTSHDSVK